MGKHFGNLIKITGVVYYVLSPHEQKFYTGCINPGIKNVIRRTRETLMWVLIPCVICYTVRATMLEIERQHCRKNPSDYECDE